MTKTYTITAVARDGTGSIVTGNPQTAGNKARAMNIARKLARSRNLVTYGPSSLAYVGREITAVVAW